MQKSSPAQTFPRAILHVDGDSFFASCEIAARPWLRDKPVVTGSERGIASSMNYVAKARGITRAMRMFEVRKLVPDVVIISSDYEAYRLYSARMAAIVRRYSRNVEEYSIDECFADLTGQDEVLHMSYAEIAAKVKADLESSLGLSFSVGLSVNKVLAKLASNKNKPSGLTVIPKDGIVEALRTIPIKKVWGIGTSTAIAMNKKGVTTALALAAKERHFVLENFAKPIVEIYEELNGAPIMQVGNSHEDPHSIQRTATFKPISKDPVVVFSELSRNIEHAAHRLRSLGLVAGEISFFVKSQSFNYYGTHIRLPRAIASSSEIVAAVRTKFASVFRPGTVYRATGVTLYSLRPEGTRMNDLFGHEAVSTKKEKVFEAVDRITGKYGEQALFLGSSMRAIAGDKPSDSRHKFGLPCLGVVR